jgi:hypothetical protein
LLTLDTSQKTTASSPYKIWPKELNKIQDMTIETTRNVYPGLESFFQTIVSVVDDDQEPGKGLPIASRER